MSHSSTTPRQPKNRFFRNPRRVHLIVARALVFTVFAQIGLGILALGLHQVFGFLIGLLALLLALSALRGSFSRSTTGLSVAFLVLVGLQGALIALADRVPVFNALHLINGFVLFGLAIVVGIESEDEGRESPP